MGTAKAAFSNRRVRRGTSLFLKVAIEPFREVGRYLGLGQKNTQPDGDGGTAVQMSIPSEKRSVEIPKKITLGPAAPPPRRLCARSTAQLTATKKPPPGTKERIMSHEGSTSSARGMISTATTAMTMPAAACRVRLSTRPETSNSSANNPPAKLLRNWSAANESTMR